MKIGHVMCVAIVLAAASAARGAPVVDGRVDGADGYTITRGLSFDDSNGANPPITLTGAILQLHQDAATSDLYVALTLPTAFSDNSYGTTRVGWGAVDHRFQDLQAGDNTRFQVRDTGGALLLDVTVDYLHQFGVGPGRTFGSGGVANGDGSVAAGNAASVSAAQTSMGFNFSAFGLASDFFKNNAESPATTPANTGYVTADPLHGTWLFDIIYELKVDGRVFNGRAFDPNWFDSVTVAAAQASPSKFGSGIAGDFRSLSDDAIPLPAAPAMGAALLFATLVPYRRRRPVSPRAEAPVKQS